MDDTQKVTTEELHLEVERWALLHTISTAVEKPMIVLSFVWLVLLIVDLTTGLSPLLGLVSNTIWIIFTLNFCIEFTIAPGKLRYLRQNWLTALALILPAIRILRLAWMVRMLRTVRAALIPCAR